MILLISVIVLLTTYLDVAKDENKGEEDMKNRDKSMEFVKGESTRSLFPKGAKREEGARRGGARYKYPNK